MLKLRQYTKTVQAINQAGPWNQVSSATGPIALFDYPVTQSPFIDLNQCAYLNYSIEVSEIKGVNPPQNSQTNSVTVLFGRRTVEWEWRGRMYIS